MLNLVPRGVGTIVWTSLIRQELLVHRLKHLPGRLAITPLGDNMRGDSQQVALRTTHVMQVTEAATQGGGDAR
jgi:hypothetical protein